MDVRDRHVIVTGGASGIGRALCQRFAAEGARAIVVADLDGDGAAAVAHSMGGHAEALDVACEEDLLAVIDRAEARSGPIDLFCANAGMVVEGGAEASSEAWQRIWEVNLFSHVIAARILVPRMLERGEGTLLHTASAAGLLTQIGSAPYAVTKSGVVALAEWLAITYGSRGLRVHALCPQAVRTAMTAPLEDGGVAGVDGVIEPEDVAEAVIQGLRTGEFLILPHPVVGEYVKRKANDIDRWIRGMQRLAVRFENGGLV
ncbi:SDR family oxidoreductase [Myxococcota bacterium]|nr:SDR family oxidoreductase [Myxococcota bacterium]